MQQRSRYFLILELAIIAVALPLLLMAHQPRGALFASLWLLCTYALWQLKRSQPRERWWPAFDWQAVRNTEIVRPVMQRFLISAALLVAFTLWMVPDKLFSLPRERPELWLMVMVLYPVLSVIPQEIIFRRFFFIRYAPLFSKSHQMALASALAFGFAHVLLNNWVAVILSTIGGFFFAQTYQKSRSLGLAIAEHALYGCFIFSIGLGWLFYSGAPHKW